MCVGEGRACVRTGIERGGRQALLGEPYRRFLGERVEASLGFGSTTRTTREG